MRVHNFRPSKEGGSVLGEFDIDIEDSWGTVYRNWRLIKSSKGMKFISGPSYTTPLAGGLKKYNPYIEMKPEKKKEFEREVMSQLGDHTTL